MTAAETWDALHQRGITLTVEGDRVRYRAPGGAMTPELLEGLRQHKAKLLPVVVNTLRRQVECEAEQSALGIHAGMLVSGALRDGEICFEDAIRVVKGAAAMVLADGLHPLTAALMALRRVRQP